MTRIVTVGTGIESCRRALAIAERHEGVVVALGDPPARGSGDGETSSALRELLAHPKAVAVGETGLDYFRDYAPPRRAARGSSTRSSSSRRSFGKPVVIIHTRAARRGHARRARRLRRARSSCTASRRCRCSSRRSSAAGTSRSPATSPTRTRTSCASRGARSRPSGCSPRPTARISRRCRCAGRPNEPANVVHTVAVLADVPRRRRRRARRADRRERARRVRAVSASRRRRSSASTSSSTRTSSA